MSQRRIQEFRDQAASYRQTASGLAVEAVRVRYLGWAADLDFRADALEQDSRAMRALPGRAETQSGTVAEGDSTRSREAGGAQ